MLDITSAVTAALKERFIYEVAEEKRRATEQIKSGFAWQLIQQKWVLGI